MTETPSGVLTKTTISWKHNNFSRPSRPSSGTQLSQESASILTADFRCPTTPNCKTGPMRTSMRTYHRFKSSHKFGTTRRWYPHGDLRTTSHKGSSSACGSNFAQQSSKTSSTARWPWSETARPCSTG